MHWTTKAKNRLDAYCKRLAEADKDIVFAELHADIQSHVQEELTSEGITVADEDAVKFVLSSMGGERGEENFSNVVMTKPAVVTAERNTNLYRTAKARFWLLVGGVILPVLAVLFSAVIGLGQHGATPTLWHSLMILMTAVTVGLYLVEAGRDKAKHSKGLGLLVGFSLFVTIYYTVVFIPLLPIGIIGILFVGLGLLVLSPLIACICQFNLLLRVKRFWFVAGGFAVGVASLISIDLTTYLTDRALVQYAEGNVEERAEAVRKLRLYGSKEVMLKRCYQRAGVKGDFLGVKRLWGSQSVAEAQAQIAFFQVTGEAFNSVTHENSRSLRGSSLGQWDNHLGGDAVAGRQKGLAMSQSRLDVHIDNASQIGYAEWIVEFENNSHINREARMKFILPDEGIVSRVTLWIGGEEREAAYNSVKKVKAGYTSVVSMNRDPVLVNMCAPNTFRLQCFPVLPNGGKMKMKVGYNFTVGSQLKAPYILERNFEIKENFRHELFVQGEVDFPTYKGKVKRAKNYQSIQDSFGFEGFQSQFITVESKREGGKVWCEDEVTRLYLTRSTELKPSLDKKFTLVIDGSLPMSKWRKKLAELSKKPEIKRIILAGDLAEEITSVEDVNFIGGRDNVPALKEALLLEEDVIWIHAGQPCEFSTSEALLQNLERGFSDAKLHSVTVAAGGNALLEKLWKVKRIGSSQVAVSEEDLEQTINQIIGDDQVTLSYDWQVTEPTEGVKVWDHLVHSAVFSETQEAWLNGEMVDDLAERAARYQLITPVSGAVVLETKEQYDAAGLVAVDGSESPKIPSVTPEPSSIVMFVLGGAAALMRRRRKN